MIYNFDIKLINDCIDCKIIKNTFAVFMTNTPDKTAALRQMARVLKPEGRLQIADILVRKPVPLASKQKADLWTGCIAGALMEHELKMSVTIAGFVGLEITWWSNIYEGAPQASSANYFGTVGINFYARKARNKKEWEDEMDRLPLFYD